LEVFLENTEEAVAALHAHSGDDFFGGLPEVCWVGVQHCGELDSSASWPSVLGARSLPNCGSEEGVAVAFEIIRNLQFYELSYVRMTTCYRIVTAYDE
jgi:hypothetical protein